MTDRAKVSQTQKVCHNKCSSILGEHPSDCNLFGNLISATDGITDSGVSHRSLLELCDQRENFIECMREMLVRHHVSPEALERDRERREALQRLGFDPNQSRMSRFPKDSKTRKGNLAEAILAEYIVAASTATLPVYRLRYNPNVEQAMKGDDILAFDLDADPVRIIVGESKFRTTSSKKAVVDIVDGLGRSQQGGIPASLQFVSDRLFEIGNTELGLRVMECAQLFVLGKLQIDFVGFLMSDNKSAQRVNKNTDPPLRNLVMISFGITSPDSIVDPCYCDLEGDV